MTSENQKWADLADRVTRGLDRHISLSLIDYNSTDGDSVYHAWRMGIIELAKDNGVPLRVGPGGEINSKSALGELRIGGINIEEVITIALLTVLQDEKGDRHDN